MRVNGPLSRYSIRVQLLVAVNAAIVGLVTIFLAYEYQHLLSERLYEKRVALEEEAKTLFPAVRLLAPWGVDRVQKYVDEVCGRMQERQSPSHHITVQLGDQTLQATAHHRASPAMLQAVRQAAQNADRRGRLGNVEMVVGRYGKGDSVVFVSEGLKNVRHSIRAELTGQLAAVVFLAATLGLVINLALLHVVTQPLDRLVRCLREIGRGNLTAHVGRFRSAELNYVASEIHAMELALAADERDRVTQMAKAREIQRNLLPDLRNVAGVELVQLFEPAEAVGGDFFDVVPTGERHVVICLADVTGHGVPAAMSAAMLKLLLQRACELSNRPADILTRINRQFMKINLYGDFATMLIVSLNTTDGQLEYASAGHETAWLIDHTGDIGELKSTGIVLGIDETSSWETRHLEMTRKGRLLMVTDGVTETQPAADGGCFGRQRLVSLLASTKHLAASRAVELIAQELTSFREGSSPHDDVTLVVVQRDLPDRQRRQRLA